MKGIQKPQLPHNIIIISIPTQHIFARMCLCISVNAESKQITRLLPFQRTYVCMCMSVCEINLHIFVFVYICAYAKGTQKLQLSHNTDIAIQTHIDMHVHECG